MVVSLDFESMSLKRTRLQTFAIEWVFKRLRLDFTFFQLLGDILIMWGMGVSGGGDIITHHTRFESASARDLGLNTKALIRRL